VNSESSSLFFYNPSRETVVYCQSRLRYCYKATVRRSNEYVSFNNNDVTTAKLANVVQTASSLEKNHNGKQGILDKQATESTDGKPSGSTSVKTPSSCIGYEVFKTLSAQHTCPIHGKGHNYQLDKCQSLLFELNKRGLPRANKASSKDKPAPETTPDVTSVSGIVAAGEMAQSSTYADAAQQVSDPTATSSVATGTTADLDALDFLHLDFGCSFMAETGPKDTRTDTTLYLAPPATHLDPTSSWITGKLRWILIGLLVLGTGPWSLLLSNITGLLPQRWHRPSHIIGSHCSQFGSIPMPQPHRTGQDQPSDASMHR
jgi:hypothetical protein